MVESADDVSVRCSLCPSWLATEVQCSLNSLMCTHFGCGALRSSDIVRVRIREIRYSHIIDIRSYLYGMVTIRSFSLVVSLFGLHENPHI
jgi:hypothetical protein